MTDYTVKELVYLHEEAFMPEKSSGLDAIVQYHLTGDEGGDFIISIRNDKCSVREGVAENPVVTMTADGDYFRDLLLGKEDGMKGFLEGKLVLTGNLKLAMKLTSLFNMSG